MIRRPLAALSLVYLLLVASLTACSMTSTTANPHAGHSTSTPLPEVTSHELDIAPGNSAHVTLPVGDTDRHFILTVPDNYDPDQAWPVIFSFHGKDDTAYHNRSYTDLDKAEAFIIYGEGVDAYWSPAPYATTTLDQDVNYLRQALDSVQEKYHVDDSRVYATGFSNGGGFVAMLACQATDMVAGVASVAGAYYDADFTDCSTTPVPVLTIHGTDDQVKKYGGGKSYGETYKSVPDTLDLFQKRNGCDTHGDFFYDTPTAMRLTYDNCDAALVHLRIEDGKHLWPGHSTDTTEGMPKDYSTDLILEFFDIPWQI